MKYVHALCAIIIAQLAGVIGSVFTASSIEGWYSTITKPSWNPPSWVFGPVWITLYTFMGYASYLVWRVQKTDKRAYTALTVYAIHLAFNAAWSVIFFGWQNPEVAFYCILALDALIVATLILFWRINKLAGALLVPYLGWVLFASYLNYTIWMLN